MQHRPGPGLTPEPPLTRLARRLSASETRAPEYQSVCASHYPAPSSKLQAPGSTALVGFSHRHVPEHSNRIRPGYGFTSRRVAHYCRLTDDPWADPALPELSGSPEVPSTRDLNVARSFRVFGSAARRSTLPPGASSSLGIGCSFRVSRPRPYRVMGSAIPLCR
jgi:hypothetical protein